MRPQARLGKSGAIGMVDPSRPAVTDPDWYRCFIPAEVAELGGETVVPWVFRLPAQPYAAPAFLRGFGEHPRGSKVEPNTRIASAIGGSHGLWPLFKVISPCPSLLEVIFRGNHDLSASTSAQEERSKRGNRDSETK